MFKLLLFVYVCFFEDEGAFCFANVGRSVCRSVRPSVDQMDSDHYLKNYLTKSLHNADTNWF